MATSLSHVTVAPKGMGLNDFVAQQEGYFAAQGLEVEFDWKTFRGTQSRWKGLAYFEQPQDVMRWGLDQFPKDRNFDALSYPASR